MLSETSAGVTHDYTYDVAGNRIMVKYGNSNRRLITKYDDLNRVKAIIDTTAAVTTAAAAAAYTAATGDAVTAYQYNISGNTVNHFHPNGTRTANEFDLLGRMKRTVTTLLATSALLSSVDYSFAALNSADGCGYDKLGNVRYMVENSATLAQRSVTNVYDKTNRLVEESVNQNQCVTSYTYDAANNRTRKTVTGTSNANTDERYLYGTPDLGYNTNQLVGIGTNGIQPDYTDPSTFRVRYTYDENGNRATRSDAENTDGYSYDVFNRLITLDFNTGNMSDTGIYHYAYDYRTRRVLTADHCVMNPSDQSTYISTYGSNITRQSFSGGSYVQTYEGNSATPSSELIRGNEMGGGTGGLLYSVIDGVATHNNYNSRGDVVNQSNASGVVTYQAQYEAFGTRKQETGTAVGRQRANTKDEDPTGLLNEGFRYRDLETGIFLTRDPMGFVDGPNVYTYVVQNPWTSFDPEGLWGLGSSNGKILDGVWNWGAGVAEGAKKLPQNIKSESGAGGVISGFAQGANRHMISTAQSISNLLPEARLMETVTGHNPYDTITNWMQERNDLTVQQVGANYSDNTAFEKARKDTVPLGEAAAVIAETLVPGPKGAGLVDDGLKVIGGVTAKNYNQGSSRINRKEGSGLC